MKKVVLAIAHKNYQPTEYGLTHEILTSNKIKVITASDESPIAVASDDSSADVDCLLNEINPTEIDGLFLIGGKGALDCLNNDIIYSLLAQMKTLNKPIGAICIAPRILAYAKVLTGKKATGWNEDNLLPEILKANGATYLRENIVVDGKIITAKDATVTDEFAQAILLALNAI